VWLIVAFEVCLSSTNSYLHHHHHHHYHYYYYVTQEFSQMLDAGRPHGHELVGNGWVLLAFQQSSYGQSLHIKQWQFWMIKSQK
jgi:hypothetical protein